MTICLCPCHWTLESCRNAALCFGKLSGGGVRYCPFFDFIFIHLLIGVSVVCLDPASTNPCLLSVVSSVDRCQILCKFHFYLQSFTYWGKCRVPGSCIDKSLHNNRWSVVGSVSDTVQFSYSFLFICLSE